MPYSSNRELPPSVRNNLPESAQTIFRRAFNGFMRGRPKSQEERGFQVAWAAVKRSFKKVGGKWTRKSEDEMTVDTIKLEERIVVDATDVRETADGYLVAMPRVARTGIQLYRGREVGRPEMDVVRVFRPEAEVFSKDSLHTFAFRPITIEHPPVAVDAKNWKQFSVGSTGGEVARDGEFVRVPMTLMDQAAIDSFRSGKEEISVGYTTDLMWTPGKDPVTGNDYDAVQTKIRVNHVALVKAARGGHKLRFGDEGDVAVNAGALLATYNGIREGRFSISDEDLPEDATPDENTALGWTVGTGDVQHLYPFAVGDTVYRRALVATIEQAREKGHEGVADAASLLLDRLEEEKEVMNDKTSTKIVDVDGVQVEMGDVAAGVVLRHMKAMQTRIDGLVKQLEKSEEDSKKKASDDAAALADLKKQVETKDVELTTLKKQLEDSKISPDKLDAMVKDREQVIGKARALLGETLVVDGKSDAEIRRAVVLAKLGDAAKEYTDEHVRVAFDTLSSSIQPGGGAAGASGSGLQRMSASFADHRPHQAGAALYDTYDKKISEAWKGTAPAN